MAEVTYLAVDGHRLSPEELKQLKDPERVEARKRAIKAEGRAEGRVQREKEIFASVGAKAIDDISLLPKLAQQHKNEVQEARARGFWKAMGVAGPVLLFAFVMGLLSGVYIQREGWAMRVSEERIPRSSVPTLQDGYQEPEYERNPREPGTAPR